MSKIGRKPININGIKIDINGKIVRYSGAKVSGVFTVPDELDVVIHGDQTLQLIANQQGRDVNRIWGLNRALLANQIGGAITPFEKKVIIEGLGYKVAQAGSVLTFSLGYSHKKTFDLPKSVELAEVDKTGQKMTFRSVDKELLGEVCAKICRLRPVEPYKGTGVRDAKKKVFRKPGKTKST